jgi:hypothetical protein
MVDKKKLRLLQMHGGRSSRALDFRPMRQTRYGRRGWKYHASCSVNLLKIPEILAVTGCKMTLGQ